MAKNLQNYIDKKAPPQQGFYYSYLLSDNSRPANPLVAAAEMNQANTYISGGAYEQVSKHLAEEMQRDEFRQRQQTGSYSPSYDYMTLNFNVRANLHSNRDVYFWNAEPTGAIAENKTMVMPTLYNKNAQSPAIIKDAMAQSPNRIIVPLGLEWPDPRQSHLNHMTALVIEPKSIPPQIFFFNPFGDGDSPLNRQYQQMAQAEIDKLKREIPGLQNAEVIKSHANIEHDGTSCAVWSEWFINTAANRNVSMSQFNGAIDSLRNNKSDAELNAFIRKRYEDNKRNFTVPAPNILQKQAPQPQPRIETPAPVRPTPITNKWQRVGNVIDNKESAYNPQKGTLLDSTNSTWYNVGNIKVPTGVYQTLNSPSNYQVIVTPHSIGAELKVPRPNNTESLDDYRGRIRKTMEFGVDVMNLKQTGFEIASKSPPENATLYVSKLIVVLEEAKRQNIDVTLSAPDKAYLNSIYEKMSQKQNRSEAENKLLDGAKLLICGETPAPAPETNTRRRP